MSPRECAICSDLRDVLSVFGEELDPDMLQAVDRWHDAQHPANSPFAAPAWDDGRGPGSAEAVEMAAFTVGPYEKLCPDCHLIHRPGNEC